MKKFISVLMSISLVLGLLPRFIIAVKASGAVSYDPVTTAYAVLNRYNYQNKDYFTSYVKSTGLYNAVSAFSGLSAGTTYTSLQKSFTWGNFLVDSGYNYTNYGKLASTGQLEVNLSATIHNVKHRHGNIFKGADSLAYQYAYLLTGYSEQAVSGYDFSTAGTATKRLGDMDFISVSNSNTMKLGIGVGHTYAKCNDGDCTIGDVVVAFADVTDPTIKSVYTCDASGSANSGIKAGKTVYLKVVFTEPIRFADNNPSNHTGITATMHDSNANKLTGSLVTLKDNYLMFKFDNTAVSGFSSKNLTMTSADFSALFGSGSWSLVQLQNGASINGSINTGTYNGAGYTTSDSLITDIAGNPLTKLSSGSAALSSACYIDGEAPYVAGITKTTQMNNGDIEKSSADEENASYRIAGVGDSITFTVNFNEKLNINDRCYNSNYFLGMLATLNVKDTRGAYVQVRAASMSQVSGGTDLKNGASQGMITSVTFSPFTVSSGMSCDDSESKIKITSITPYSDAVTVTDLCGNSYADSGNDWAALNTNACILDVDAPTVVTSVTQGTSGEYAPVTVTKSGSAITEFYFPITITDDSGTNALKGGFSWTNGVSGAKGFKYEYAVTAGADEPENTQWQSGTTESTYSFTQVSAGNFIHIRLLDSELYNLQSTSISIYPKDYAGNSGKTTFALDYSADRVAPSVSVASTGKAYDSGTMQGSFTANVTVKDDGGLASVYYLWTTDGTIPTAESTGWTATGSFTTGDTSASADAIYGGITGTFTGELYIKAADVSGNVSVSDLGAYTYDLSAPAHTLTYTVERTAAASLTISDLASGSAVVVMIKKPGSTDNTYYVSVVDSTGHLGDILNNTSIGKQVINDVYSWQTYTVTSSGGIYSFSFVSAPDNVLNTILNGSYYGEVDITVLVGQEPTATSTFNSALLGTVEDGAFVYSIVMQENGGYRTSLSTAGTGIYPAFSESVTLNAAPGNSDIYSADITSPDTLNTKITTKNSGYPLSSNIGFDPEDSSTQMLSTLEGVSFEIGLANTAISGWGVDDVDFSKTYISVYRTYGETGAAINYGNGEQIGENLYLAPQTTQSITLPAGAYPSGQYSIVLTVTTKASGTDYTFKYSGNVYVDATDASQSFGFAGYYTNVYNSYYNINKSQYTYYGPFYGAADSDGKAYTQYTAGNGTVYIPVNSTVGSNGVSARLYFTADDVSVTGSGAYYGEKAIKAWNITSGVDAAASEAAAVWYSANDANDYSSLYSFYLASYVDSADGVLAAYNGSATDFGYLPLIINTLNTIAFQVVNGNGKTSELRYVYIYPMESTVSGSVSLTDAADFVKEGELSFTPASGQSMNGTSVYVYDYSDFDYFSTQNGLTDITDSYDMDTNTYSLPLTEAGQHFYFVYTLDSYGNYTLFDDDSDPGGSAHFWSLTDSGAPTVSSSSCSDASNGKFAATYVFSEDTAVFDNTQTLRVYYDSDYMNALGLNSDSSDSSPGFMLSLPTDGHGTQTVYSASASNLCGIYQVDVTRFSNQEKLIQVTIYGVIKYDSSLAEGTGVTHTLFATLEDPFGNVSGPGTGSVISVNNTKPAYVSGYYDQYSSGGGSTSYRGLIASFNTPVVLEKSIGTNSPSSYSETKTSELPIFGDGTYDISFKDIFGTKWTQEITLTDVFKDYSLRVSLSETGYTSDAVTVTITADSPDTTQLLVYDSTGGAWTALSEYYADSASFSVSSNSELHIILRNSNDGSARVDEMFYITNIISGAPTATVQWYYSEFKSDTPPSGVTSTTGAVTAWYTATRGVTPSGGTAASYTFYPGDTVTSYTFEFTDEAGNEGSVTATLPITLAEPALPVSDTTAPKYEINIFGMADGVYFPAGYYSSTTSTDKLERVIAQAGYVQSYCFEVNVTEDSAYRFVLLSGVSADTSGVTYSGGSSDTVDGAVLSGRTITVTKAAALTLAIVDKADNVSSFSLSLGSCLDTTGPTSIVTKVYTDFYTVRTYIKLSDLCDSGTETGDTALLSPAGMASVTDSSSAYYGQYYCDFTDNKSLTVTFRDGAGNKGSTTITVASLDTSSPTATVLWSPYYYDSYLSTSGDPTTPPNNLTNKDVVAKVSYSKSIGSVSSLISFYNGSAWGSFTSVTDTTYDSYFTLKTTDDTATVSFHAGNVAVQLVAVALNGRTVTNTLYLGDVIDTTAPTVTPSVKYNCKAGYETGTPYSATITLTPGEDVYCADSSTPGVIIGSGSDISFTVYKKGNYSYHFTDIAGNVRVVTVAVDKDMDSTPPEISVDTGDGTITNGNVTVSVSTDEDGTLVVTGANKTELYKGAASGNTAISLTIANNGSYGVAAYDEAGNKTTTAFVIGCIDKTAPSIAFNPVTVSIRQDSSTDALKALLDAGYSVNDDFSDQSAITVLYDSSGVELNTVGIYSVTYTATDEAGNAETSTRFVKVYSKEQLEVLLNGKATENWGTTTLTSTTITISVNNPSGSEPYVIYLRQGICTEGQMKKSYTIVTPDASNSFTVPSTGFYTIYIVTQSRQTYLTTIYID